METILYIALLVILIAPILYMSYSNLNIVSLVRFLKEKLKMNNFQVFFCLVALAVLVLILLL